MESHGTDPKTRGKLADELLEAMQAIWTREIAEYHGDFVNLDPLYAWPKPVQRPHPPLYFGGGPAAFPRIARFGGGWYAVSPSSDELAASAAQLRTVTGTDSRIIAAHVGPVTEAALRGYADSGAERVVFDLDTLSEPETLARLDEYAALARSLGWSPATPARKDTSGESDLASGKGRPQHRLSAAGLLRLGWSASGGRVGEDAFEHAGGLAHLDQVAVGVAQVATYLGFSVEWFGKELCAFGFGIGIKGCDVGDTHVQKRRDRITSIRRSQRDIWLVGRRAATRVHYDPAVGDFDDGWILLQYHLSTEDVGVEVARAGDVAHGQEMCQKQPLLGGR
jgi:hypothetical protein